MGGGQWAHNFKLIRVTYVAQSNCHRISGYRMNFRLMLNTQVLTVSAGH